MKSALTFILLFIFTKIAFAQPDVKLPVFSINGKKADPISFLAIDPESIQKLNILKPEKAKAYGKYASKYGAVLIELKKGVKLISLSELLKIYSIEATAIDLPLVFSYGFSTDRLPVTSPKSFYVANSAIQSVGIKAANLKEKRCLFIVRKMMDEKPKSKFAVEIASLYKLFYEVADFYYPKQDVIIVGK
ncbi:MAG: hypothetical protein EOP00_30865 [Pedobacter sp.]|nr:MAG: hypothetical protein EOP00_30865 [Pedobacter sp.]